MWTSKDFKTYDKQFDFTSSGRGKPTFTALKIDDTDFINMVEALDGEIGDNQVFQTVICDHCGYYRCSAGNWIAVRRFGNFIYLIPAFVEMKEEPDKGEYDPPSAIRQNGAFWFSAAEFNNFKKLVPELDKLKSINQLSKFEVVSLYKWDTPHKMFGDFPDFQALRKDMVLAVSDLDNETVFEILERKLGVLERSTDFEIRPLTKNDKVLSVFLDGRSITEWKALCETEVGYDLLLGGTFVITAK